METFTDEGLVVKVKLKNIKGFDQKCESCKKSVLIHTGIQAHTRSETVDDDELIQIWSDFRIWMRKCNEDGEDEQKKNNHRRAKDGRMAKYEDKVE